MVLHNFGHVAMKKKLVVGFMSVIFMVVGGFLVNALYEPGIVIAQTTGSAYPVVISGGGGPDANGCSWDGGYSWCAIKNRCTGPSDGVCLPFPTDVQDLTTVSFVSVSFYTLMALCLILIIRWFVLLRKDLKDVGKK